MENKKQYCECPLCDNASEAGCMNEATILVPQSESCGSDYWLCRNCAGCAAVVAAASAASDDSLHNPLLQYQIVYQDGEPMSEWTWDLQSLLRRRDKLQIVMDYAVVIIDENENLVEADSFGPAPDWLRKALDERAQTYEDAADTADKIEKVNATLPNDEPPVWLIDKREA